MVLFYVRYVNWTLNHEEYPPRQHSPVRNSPPVVASPPRRKMYKSETSSTESATNASSSQQPEIERTYMSNDTSTRLVKKKKTSTKALVKRLLGVVSDLTSKVDRVLQKKKDEPDTGFGEEDEEMINEEEEETYYHGIQLDYDDIATHGLEGKVGRTPTHVEPSPDVGEHHTKTVTHIVRPQRKRGVAWYQRTPFTVVQNSYFKFENHQNKEKKAVESPEKENEDIVNEESNDVSNHLLLDSVHAANTWKVHIYDSARSMNFFSKYLIDGEFKSFGDSIISKLDVIEYWNDFPDGHKDNAIVEFIDIVDVPQ
ncbi:unnamed protein product [Lactuca virosa]|uniref:Uncharacterized protein n=1 Tax=Lactuca virosa TaxID=75947 RepID=A0AAU9PVW5_9ASTR|nr:unnamed protein product [Lactuca virosa]